MLRPIEVMFWITTSLSLKHTEKGSDMISFKSLVLGIATSSVLAGFALADAGHGHDKVTTQTELSHEKAQSAGHDTMTGNMMLSMHHQMMNAGMMDMLGMRNSSGDSETTPEEMRARLQATLKDYDADGNGSLSIDEFETYHSALIREKMVNRFQHLDADGNGAVTEQEMTAPADQMDRPQGTHKRTHRARTDATAETLPGQD